MWRNLSRTQREVCVACGWITRMARCEAMSEYACGLSMVNGKKYRRRWSTMEVPWRAFSMTSFPSSSDPSSTEAHSHTTTHTSTSSTRTSPSSTSDSSKHQSSTPHTNDYNHFLHSVWLLAKNVSQIEQERLNTNLSIFIKSNYRHSVSSDPTSTPSPSSASSSPSESSSPNTIDDALPSQVPSDLSSSSDLSSYYPSSFSSQPSSSTLASSSSTSPISEATEAFLPLSSPPPISTTPRMPSDPLATFSTNPIELESNKIPPPPSPSSYSSTPSDFQSFDNPRSTFVPRENEVPSTSIERAFGFGSLAFRMVAGTVSEQTKRIFKPASLSTSSSVFLSEANVERIVAALCRMRGAALKVGQMLSIQDEMMPPQFKVILERVRAGADVMPRNQLESTLNEELGENWESRLASFDWTPFAAASIGQCHLAQLKDGRKVVIKVQYPGVADSISSDVNNVRLMLKMFNVFPKGLYLEQTMNAAKEELTQECDYLHEAESQRKYRTFLHRYQENFFQSVAAKSASNTNNLKSSWIPKIRWNIPQIIDEFTTSRVITSEFINGIPVDQCCVGGQYEQSQDTRNALASSLLHLCLTELFQFHFMQTDPNWSNFIFDPSTMTLHCIDFGATRSYEKLFVDEYLRMVYACAERNRDAVYESSLRLGFLIGDEITIMKEAHIEAATIVGEPFSPPLPTNEGEIPPQFHQYPYYDFTSSNFASRISPHTTVMLHNRLTPPPKPSYTLHRKLSGCFLTCKKLDAKIRCRDPFLTIFENYSFSTERLSGNFLRPS